MRDPATRVATLDPMRGERDTQVVLHREPGEHVAPANLHDPLLGAGLGGEIGDGLAVQPHRATVREPEPADHPEQRRLPCAVGPEHRECLPFAHLEVDVEQDLHRPVAEVEVVNLQQRRVGARAHRIGAGAFLLHLLDHPAHVALDEARAVPHERGADDGEDGDKDRERRVLALELRPEVDDRRRSRRTRRRTAC